MTHAIGIERASAAIKSKLWEARDRADEIPFEEIATAAIAAYLSALKPSGDAGEVVDRLRDAEIGYRPHVVGKLFAEAITTITTLERQLATAREALRDLLRGEYESAEPGLCDCVDNHGKPYQSQFLADRIAKAEAILTPGVSDAE